MTETNSAVPAANSPDDAVAAPVSSSTTLEPWEVLIGESSGVHRISCPEVKRDLYCRLFGIDEGNQLFQNGDHRNGVTFSTKLLAMSVVNADGSQFFTEQQWARWPTRYNEVLQQIVDQVMSINGMGSTAAKTPVELGNESSPTS